MVTRRLTDPHWGRIRNRRGLICKTLIRRVAAHIAERFHPDKIILFGSYAYGEPDEDSDVDLLVVMPARNEIDQSVRILNAIDVPFALDLIVRTPKNLKWRLEEGDWFLREVVGQGKVLYEKADEGVGDQSGDNLAAAKMLWKAKPPMTTRRLTDPRWGRIRNRRGLICRTLIRRVAAHIVERFQPDKIILFGSYAYGAPDQNSDVDLLVVMPARNTIDQSLRIWNAIDPPFALDVIVRTPKTLKWRLEEGDWFLREVVAQGKVLYEKTDEGVGE